MECYTSFFFSFSTTFLPILSSPIIPCSLPQTRAMVWWGGNRCGVTFWIFCSKVRLLEQRTLLNIYTKMF